MEQEKAALLELSGVTHTYRVQEGFLRHGREFDAVRNFDFKVMPGVSYGLVGESGSGKSTVAGILTGLVRPSSGTVRFEGRELFEYLRRGVRHFRQTVQMVFQNPYLSLDPRWTVREIVEEGIRELSFQDKSARVKESLELVRLPEVYLERKPRELSGGERQRVAIARALAIRPHFIILDEPTSQLDVSIQAQIIQLLGDMRDRLKVGFLFISHDLALVSQIADEIMVMYEGQIVEKGPRQAVLTSPTTSYTRKLLNSVPAGF